MNGWAAMIFFVLAVIGWCGIPIMSIPGHVLGFFLVGCGYALNTAANWFIHAGAWCMGVPVEKDDE